MFIEASFIKPRKWKVGGYFWNHSIAVVFCMPDPDYSGKYNFISPFPTYFFSIDAIGCACIPKDFGISLSFSLE